MIEPVTPRAKAPTVQETAPVEPVRLRPDQHPPTDAAAPAPAHGQHNGPHAAAATQRVTAASAGFEVHLDGATLRLYSELRDPATDRVIIRLPTGYQPKQEPLRTTKPTEFET